MGSVETTLIVNWHCPGLPPLIASIVPPVSGIGRVPATIAPVAKPQVLLPIVSGEATVTPLGSVSVTLTPVADDALGLSSVIVSSETCPATTEFGAKLLLMPTDANASAGASSAATSRAAARSARGAGRWKM